MPLDEFIIRTYCEICKAYAAVASTPLRRRKRRTLLRHKSAHLAGSSAEPLRVMSWPLSLRVMDSLWTDSILPVAVPVPYFQLTLVPLRIVGEGSNLGDNSLNALKIRWF